VKILTEGIGYELRAYPAANKGPKVGGLYQPTGSPFKVMKIENPGVVPLDGTDDDELYATARWETSFLYKIPVPDGPLKVQLQFAELYHDAIEGAVFDVTVEGQTVLSDYDVLAAAGSKGTAHIEDVSTIVKDGELNLDFASSVYGAQVAAIKVVRDTIPSVSG